MPSTMAASWSEIIKHIKRSSVYPYQLVGVWEYRYNPIYHSFNIAFNNTSDYCRSTIAFMSVHCDLDLQSTRRTNDILRCIHGVKGKYKYNFYFKLQCLSVITASSTLFWIQRSVYILHLGFKQLEEMLQRSEEPNFRKSFIKFSLLLVHSFSLKSARFKYQAYLSIRQ